jgi:hypothetical protein
LQPPQNTESETDHERDHRLEVKKYRVEVATFCGLAAYVVINFFMLCAVLNSNNLTKTATKSAADTFRMSERAWIGFKGQQPTLVNGKMVALVQSVYLNAGKSPAAHVKTMIRLRVGDPIPTNQGTLNVHGPILPECANDKIPLPPAEGVLIVPNIEHMATVIPESEVTSREDDIVNNRAGLYLTGCIDYNDEFGEWHRTHLCAYQSLQTPSIFIACKNGNGAS